MNKKAISINGFVANILLVLGLSIALNQLSYGEEPAKKQEDEPAKKQADEPAKKQAEEPSAKDKELEKLAESLKVSNGIKDKTVKDKTNAEIAIRYATIGEYSKAIEISKLLTDSLKSSTLIAITVKYAKSGEKSVDILADALDVARGIKNVPIKDKTISEIAIRYGEIDAYAKAVDVTKPLTDTQKSNALIVITRRYAKSGQTTTEILDQAVIVAKVIRDVPIKDKTLSEISIRYAEMGDPVTGLETARLIKDDNIKSKAVQAIGKVKEKK
ncbi:MAG: hypothetical protein V1701_10715 [Planctomycetota bacterium]